MKKLVQIIVIFHFSLFTSYAQVGEYRTDLAVGFNGGVAMSNVAFVPKVPQGFLNGPTFGFTARYTCEKYFNSICAVVAEVNYTQMGWKENILDLNDQPVTLHTDESQTLNYARKINYIQVPLLARLGWGRERSGFQFFIQLGPQVGFYMSDKTESNFDVRNPAFNPKIENGYFGPEYQYGDKRVSHVVAQDSMAVENTVDYGIAVGGGLEFSHRHLGHFIVEGRYYYGLGNIYGATKRDYFGRSNFGTIMAKFTYLFDIVRTKNSKIK
ncbi:MAG: PorT family protein [Prevotella sp.]|nr:PorT family protein [Prevotella sp.]